jgi:hypothetical protein
MDTNDTDLPESQRSPETLPLISQISQMSADQEQRITAKGAKERKGDRDQGNV